MAVCPEYVYSFFGFQILPGVSMQQVRDHQAYLCADKAPCLNEVISKVIVNIKCLDDSLLTSIVVQLAVISYCFESYIVSVDIVSFLNGADPIANNLRRSL